jgi:hypothetical protein
MTKSLRVLCLTMLLGTTLAVQVRAASIVLPRAGQVGIGIQGQYGSLLKSGELGEEFGAGPGLAVRLRYRMRYERAIGLSFQTQNLDSRSKLRPAPAGAFIGGAQAQDTTNTRDHLVLTLAGFDIFQMFDTRSKTTKWVSAGLGLAQVSARLSNKDVQYPIAGDGMYLSAGAGIEKFFYRSWAYDLNTHYLAVFHDGKVNHDLQASAGMIFYVAY